MAKEQLPQIAHDHFRKANVLHGYTQTALGEAVKHALEAGNELLAAKTVIPHGRWENECARLFDGSPRTARFYMQFSKDMKSLKTAERNAVLLLESTLDGAAKAAKKAAKPATKPRQKPVVAEIVEEEEEVEVDYGKCPNCAGTTWDEDEDGVSCAKCCHPYGEPAGDVDDDRLKTQRQKTLKTIDALMRAFDDLQCMLARPEHDDVISLCKSLLAVARAWK